MSRGVPHIVILGAGLIGLCTADSLRTKGARVTVVDARSGPCEGTSFSNSGMIHPSQAGSWAPGAVETPAGLEAAIATAELGRHSAVLLRERMQALGLTPRPEGCLQLYARHEDVRAAQSGFVEIGIRAETYDDIFGRPACLFPDDLSGNARDFGCALEADLKARGVTFIYGVDNFAVRRTDDDALKVMAGESRLTCDHVVVAAGPDSPQVLARLGLDLPLDIVTGVAVNFARPADMSKLPARPVMDVLSRSALTVFDSCVRISGGWNARKAEDILPRWREIAPDLVASLGDPVSVWVGRRPVSPAGRPYIGATPRSGLWVNTGHGHMGWTLCAGSGELMAEMILEDATDTRFCLPGGTPG